jgi:hypothetical protein
MQHAALFELFSAYGGARVGVERTSEQEMRVVVVVEAWASTGITCA